MLSQWLRDFEACCDKNGAQCVRGIGRASTMERAYTSRPRLIVAFQTRCIIIVHSRVPQQEQLHTGYHDEVRTDLRQLLAKPLLSGATVGTNVPSQLMLWPLHERSYIAERSLGLTYTRRKKERGRQLIHEKLYCQ